MSGSVQLDEFYFVSPQLNKEDLAVFKNQSFERIINNRPDFESEDQPLGEDLREIAEKLGLEYINNPIDLSKLTQKNVDLQRESLVSAKKTLAFCRTGTRSSVLWVLLNNQQGTEYDELYEGVLKKGFDLTRCASAMAPLIRK